MYRKVYQNNKAIKNVVGVVSFGKEEKIRKSVMLINNQDMKNKEMRKYLVKGK